MTDDELNDLCGSVCHLADLKTNAEARRKKEPYPGDLENLILAARKVKAGYGFAIYTMRT